MNLKKLVYGIYPRSDRLRQAISKWERGNLGSGELTEVINDEKKTFYEMMIREKIDFFTDPISNWHDIFRPIASRIEGIRLGPLTRFFETNTFYRKPLVDRIGGMRNPFNEQDSNEYDLPSTPYLHHESPGYLLFLPGIGTFYKLSETNLSWNQFSENLLNIYSELVKQVGAGGVFFYEEIPVNLDIYNTVSNKVFLRVSRLDGNYNSTDFSVYSLISSDPYYSSKYSNLPGYSIVDSTTTMMEKNLIENLKKYSQDFPDLLLTHNNYFDFLPRKIADLKVRLLGGVL